MPRTRRPIQIVNGERFVLIPETELEQLERRAARGEPALPEYPLPDAAGNRPAVAFARVSIARSITEQRTAAGMTQAELAHAAGIRPETLSRIESGKHSPTVRTVEKIEAALKPATGRTSSR